MSDKDRFMAISRSSEYIKGYEELRNLFNLRMNLRKRGEIHVLVPKFELAQYDLCIKWGIGSFIRPRLPIEEAMELARIKSVLKRIPYGEIPEERRHTNAFASPNWGNLSSFYLTGILPQNVFEIDITKSTKELVKDFRQKVGLLKQNAAKEKIIKKTTYNPWEIWDMVQSGLNLNAIARKFHEKSTRSGRKTPRGKRSPAYNTTLWLPYKRVERAYRQAVKMIQAVESSVLKTQTAPTETANRVHRKPAL